MWPKVAGVDGQSAAGWFVGAPVELDRHFAVAGEAGDCRPVPIVDAEFFGLRGELNEVAGREGLFVLPIGSRDAAKAGRVVGDEVPVFRSTVIVFRVASIAVTVTYSRALRP